MTNQRPPEAVSKSAIERRYAGLTSRQARSFDFGSGRLERRNFARLSPPLRMTEIPQLVPPVLSPFPILFIPLIPSKFSVLFPSPHVLLVPPALSPFPILFIPLIPSNFRPVPLPSCPSCLSCLVPFPNPVHPVNPVQFPSRSPPPMSLMSFLSVPSEIPLIPSFRPFFPSHFPIFPILLIFLGKIRKLSRIGITSRFRFTV